MTQGMTGRDTFEELMQTLDARQNEPLSRHTFVQVGGPADWFVVARDLDTFHTAAQAARYARLPLTVLGAGSNVLVRDGGLRGLVLRNESRSCRRLDDVTIEVDAGARFATLARLTARAGLRGLEWAAGIPGAIGGGLPTNAGAYGASLADVLVSVRTIAPNGDAAELSAAQLHLRYRDSRLRSGDLRGHIATTLTLRLQPGETSEALAEIDRVESLRKANAPVGPSLGSTFKNPETDERTAGQLIDEGGCKGMRIGAAQVSERHANYILNVDVGHAHAADFLTLIELIRTSLAERIGVQLEPEIAVIGEEAAGGC